MAADRPKCAIEATPANRLEASPLDILKETFGVGAAFRDGQSEAIAALERPGARLLLVQATGWGKSVVYGVAARRLRFRGPTIVVSPLVALMRNQEKFLGRFGLRAAAIHSENRPSWPEVFQDLSNDRLDLLFVSPERLASPEFHRTVLTELVPRLALAVIDEAHCISEWGHDFRPEYRSVMRHLTGLRQEATILAATATAPARVEEDLKRQFGPFLEVQRGRLVRPGLRLLATRFERTAERLAWLAKYLPRFEGAGIVYTLTIFDAKEVARWLRRQGIEAEAYHADLEPERRIELETAFAENRIKALVATTALGMGYDKADVGYVVHYQRPPSLVAYYQQIGRAGRALERAHAVLLAEAQDEAIAESFVDSARPPTWVFEVLAEALRERPRTFEELAHAAPVAASMVRHALDILLSVDAVWRDEDGRYFGSKERMAQEVDNGDAVRSVRRAEWRAMDAYLESSECRMQGLAGALGDSLAKPCGVCDRCRPVAEFRLDPALVASAEAFHHGEPKILAPRTVLPAPALDGKRRIPAELQNEEGLVLGMYGAEGWGQRVKEGKYVEGRFGEALLEAATRAVERLPASPQWLTWIPSSRRTLLAEFARHLAERLGIEAADLIQRPTITSAQKNMSTSEEQFYNVWSNTEVVGHRQGIGLLLDDIVDSGWTLTVAGLRLRQAGCGPVIPLALAAASSSRIKFADEASRE